MKLKSRPLTYAILQQLYYRHGHVSTNTTSTAMAYANPYFVYGFAR